jgi:hypothetical protein
MRTQKTITSLLVTAALALGTISSVQAADKKADANGTWTWTQQGRGGAGGNANANATPRKSTLKLKADGEKLTGTLTAPAGGRGGGGGAEPTPTEISDGKIKGDEVSFSVKREFNGNAIVTKYNGKLDGDKITGKIERPGRNGGDPTSTDWTATREAAK